MTRRIQSATSINTYLRCPRKYYLRYIKRLKEKPSIHLIRGKVVHEAIARFTQTTVKDRDVPLRSKETLLKIFQERWQSQAKEIEKLRLSKEDINGFYQESALMLLGWMERHEKKGCLTARSEVKLFSKRHGVMGILDAIYRHKGQVHIVDYKTSSNSNITDEIKLQLAIYALLYMENFGQMPDIVAIDFLKKNEEKRFSVNDGLIQYAKDLCDYIHRKTDSKDEQDYPCKCGGWCERDFVLENGGR